MTSEALITKLTQPFTLMPSSSTASLVIEDVTIFPPMSTRTCEVVAPFLTSTTTPLMWLRALMRMVTYHQFSHAHDFSRSRLGDLTLTQGCIVRRISRYACSAGIRLSAGSGPDDR